MIDVSTLIIDLADKIKRYGLALSLILKLPSQLLNKLLPDHILTLPPLPAPSPLLTPPPIPLLLPINLHITHQVLLS